MGRRSVEHRHVQPGSHRWLDAKCRRNGEGIDYQVVDRVLESDVTVDPKDVSLARFDLRFLLIVSVKIVRFEMPMRHGVGMVRIRLVDVLRRDRDRTHQPRCKSENQSETPD